MNPTCPVSRYREATSVDYSKQYIESMNISLPALPERSRNLMFPKSGHSVIR